jgi:DNA-binding CsgD family transcriptional regulator
MTGLAIRNGTRRVDADVFAGERLWLLESAEQVAKLGSWEWLAGSDEPSWSDNLYRIFGLEPGQLTPTRGFVLEQAHPDDRERLARYIEMTRRIADPPPIEYRIVQPGRGVRYLRSTITTLESGAERVRRIVGTVQDLTDQRLADREIAAHVAVSRVLADWDRFEEDGKRLLRGLAEAMEFVFGALWLPDRDLLTARLLWSDFSIAEAAQFEAATLALRVPRGVGLLGHAWEREAPVNVTDVLLDPDYRRRKAAARAGLHGALAFPALHAGEVLAVLEFYCPEESRPTARLIQTIGAIGNELGEFLSRRAGQLHSPPLTPRELQVLQLTADGCSRAKIADRLTVSPATVATHMKHIFEKLDVGDRASAVAIALRQGLIA